MKNKSSPLILPGILTISILIAALYIPGLHEDYQLNKEVIAQQQETLSKKQQELAQLESEFEKFSSLTQEEQEAVIRKFFDKLNQEELLTSYDTIKKGTGISIQNVSFTPQTTSTTPLKPTSVSMTLTAPSKEQLLRAVELIEKEVRIMKIININLQSDKTQSRANLTLHVYSNT